MYCRNCAHQLADKAEFCVACGQRPLQGTHFCQACGAEPMPAAEICVKCGVRLRRGEEKEWLVALLLSFVVGASEWTVSIWGIPGWESSNWCRSAGVGSGG